MIVFNRGPTGAGSPDIDDSERRHAGHVSFGVVRQVNYANPPTVRVAIGDETDDEGHYLSDWLPMGGARAGSDSEWHPLEVGERVAVLSESGELQNGIVIPAGFYSSDNPAPGDKAGLWRKKFQDGATLEYDRDSGELAFTAINKATIAVGAASIVISGTSIIMTAGGKTFTLGGSGVESSGLITGDSGLTVTGGAFTHSGKNVGSDHTHTGVASGSAVSGPPS